MCSEHVSDGQEPWRINVLLIVKMKNTPWLIISSHHISYLSSSGWEKIGEIVHQQYGESVAWRGNLSTQEHLYLEETRYIKEESTLAVLEDNLPHIKLDSMIMGTIEMELIEVYMIQQLSHCETIASSLIAIAPNIGQ